MPTSALDSDQYGLCGALAAWLPISDGPGQWGGPGYTGVSLDAAGVFLGLDDGEHRCRARTKKRQEKYY